jgi:hypothetical protein
MVARRPRRARRPAPRLALLVTPALEPRPSRQNADSRCLPVLHYIEDLETLTRKVGSPAKTVIEESGTNMLYVTLRFLEWYESDHSRQTHLAPLLTILVAPNRHAAKDKGFRAAIEYSGEDFVANLSLVEKIRRDFPVETGRVRSCYSTHRSPAVPSSSPTAGARL